MAKTEWGVANVNKYNLIPLLARHPDEMLIEGLHKGVGISEGISAKNKAA